MISLFLAAWVGGAACAVGNRLANLGHNAPKSWPGWVDLGMRAMFWQADLAQAVRRSIANRLPDSHPIATIRVAPSIESINKQLQEHQAAEAVPDSPPDAPAEASAAPDPIQSTAAPA